MIRLFGIDMQNIAPEITDSPLGVRSSAGKIFGATGGVMEAALRTAYKKLTGNELTNFKITAIRGLKGRKETKDQDQRPGIRSCRSKRIGQC